MRILVTGGLGFIGSHLCESLSADGHELVIIDDLSTGKRENAPAGARVIIDDVARAGMYDEVINDVDAVFHLAAIASVELSHHHWMRTHQVNAGGLVNLFDSLARAQNRIPVVYASSAAIYGGTNSGASSEQSLIDPGSAYGADKYGCELHGRVAAQIHGIPTIGLRFFNVYGPKQDPNSLYWGVVSIFAGKVAQGKKLTIHGDGEQSRDFIYVADIVRGLKLSLHALTSAKLTCGVFNLCTGHATSVNEIAQTLGRIMQRQPVIEHGPKRMGDARFSLGDPTLAKNTLGFSAEVSLDEGLQHTLDWLKDNL